jgi:hypothetical protein
VAELGPLPVVDNPYRVLGIHPNLVGSLKPDQLEQVVRAVGKTLLKQHHPSTIPTGLSEEQRQKRGEDMLARRTPIVEALERLSVPENAKRAAREYRNLSLQDEVDRVSEFVEEKRELLAQTRKTYNKFLTERALLGPEHNITRLHSAQIEVYDALAFANFRDSLNSTGSKLPFGSAKYIALAQKSFHRTISIDAQGKVTGGAPPFFPEEPVKHAVGILRIDGEDLQLQLIEKLFRQQRLTSLRPDHSLVQYVDGEPLPSTPWSEFPRIVSTDALARLAYLNYDDAIAKLSVRYNKSTDDHQSYLITSSRNPDYAVGRDVFNRPVNQALFYIEGLIRDVTELPSTPKPMRQSADEPTEPSSEATKPKRRSQKMK